MNLLTTPDLGHGLLELFNPAGALRPFGQWLLARGRGAPSRPGHPYRRAGR